jgi:uncharacterized protein (DUF697 family)
MDSTIEMAERRRRAEEWVNKYAVAGAAAVLLVSIIPGAASVILCAFELTITYQIGAAYRNRWTVGEAKSVAASMGLAAVAGTTLAMEAAILLGPLAFFAKPLIAAGIIKGLGRLIVKHFEHFPPDATSQVAIEHGPANGSANLIADQSLSLNSPAPQSCSPHPNAAGGQLP